MEEARDELVRSVGEVCISASSLEWCLAYLTSVLRRWSDERFINTASRSGAPLREFRSVVRSLAVLQVPELQDEAERILADAERLLGQRHRIVHSVVLDELEPGSRLYEAWHAKSEDIWSVDPANLNNLARDLKQCAAAADAFGTAWEERAEDSGWPDLDLA